MKKDIPTNMRKKTVPSRETTPGPRRLDPTHGGTAEAEVVLDPHGVLVISKKGDTVLDIRHPSSEPLSFRVETSALKTSSGYFKTLLDGSRFEEGQIVNEALSKLKDQSTESIPSDRLPHIKIEDIGPISPIKSLSTLLTDFFRLLHNLPLPNPHPPLTNLANLTAVADRFSALDVLRTYAHSKRLFQLIDTRTAPTTKRTQPLERLHQRVYISLHLHHAPWLLPATQRLIQTSTLQPADETAPAWFNLPSSLVMELQTRRHALLSTLSSLLAYFLAQYTSRRQQCRLGYDSSPACDSFQLGETVKFLLKAGSLHLAPSLLPQSVMVDTSDAEAGSVEVQTKQGYEGDVAELLERLRQVPNYQVDGNHHHCGLRARLLPCLESVQKAMDECGICYACWTSYREEYAWSLSKGPLVWRREGVGINGSGSRAGKIGGVKGDEEGRRCLEKHISNRDMCLAGERVWESERGLMSINNLGIEGGLVGMKLQPS